ncbi:MAG: zinc-dependent metalloprotease [Bacteroidaceae bacterium]|nr:zinc-dependent metalloprotease [Bacteroidaceae bacterium]
MKKTFLLAFALAAGFAVAGAQEINEITFENGHLILADDAYCSFAASPDKTPKAPKAPKAPKEDKKKGAAAAPKAGVPKSPIFNDKAAMLPATKDEDNWFIEVPDSLLGRMLLTVTRFTSTPAGLEIYGGEQLRHQTVYFEKTFANGKDALLLRQNRMYMHADTIDAIAKAVNVSSSDPILGIFKIEETKDHKYKINISSLLLQNDAFSLANYHKTELRITMQNMGASYVESIHSYPINTEIRVVRTFNTSNGGTHTFGMNTSFVLLPKEPMRQRIFDPRVGFFIDGYELYSDAQQSVEERYFITRRRLEPKNEEDAAKQRNGELIEPKKQIVYYIDPGTPKQWRPYLIQGVNDWNVAFEQAGWKNAITAKEWPENDSTMSMEDARYSFIMYLASDIANAYGPNIHDPRSGEIMESHVGWYHNVMKLVHDWYQVQCSAIDPEARKAKFSDELMGELIRFVSSHEIGHTLGLRHNFGSSSTVPVDSLRSNSFLEKWGHTPSIMDYARFNYVAQPGDGVEVKNLFPRINDYDKWAIEWGYKPVFDATSAEDEQHVLQAEVTRRLDANKRLWWGDGERGVADPRCQTEDLSNDAIKASELGIENLKRILPQLASWNYWGTDVTSDKVRTMYGQVVNQYFRYMLHVANNLVGVYNTTAAPEQQAKMLQIPPVEKAKAVVPFLKEQLFEKPEWLVNVPYADRIFANPDDQLQSIANRILPSLISTYRIGQLNPKYGAANYLGDLKDAIFKGFNTSQPVDSYDRFLQRTFVNTLCNEYTSMRNSTANDALAAVLMTLKDIDRRLKNVSNADPVSEAHYTMLSDKLQRALVVK